MSDGEQVEGGEDTDKEPDAASDTAPPRPRPYVHLSCVHCKEKCATFAVSFTFGKLLRWYCLEGLLMFLLIVFLLMKTLISLKGLIFLKTSKYFVRIFFYGTSWLTRRRVT